MTGPGPVPDGAAARRLADGRDDVLVREEPLLLVVHGRQLLTMRTPGRDEDLATGFLIGEGVIARADEIVGLSAHPGDPDAHRADELHVTLQRPPTGLAQERLARTHEVRSSCGVCGMADPDALLDGLPPLLPGVPKLATARLPALLALLQAHQPLFAATGGCHGALLATSEGTPLGAAEDVGRHNALDKAIGQAARAGADLARAVAVLSGRAGADLVLKCLRARIPCIVSVSAPSAFAFDLCRAAGATLVGFLRGERFTVHTDSGRLLPKRA